MHILFVNARYAPEGIAGPAFTTQVLAEQLAGEGDRATVVCRTTRPGIVEEFVAGVQVLRIGLEIPPGEAIALTSKLVERIRPDVIHTLFPRELPLESIAALAAEHRIPLVHTLLAFFLLCPHGSLMRDGRRCMAQCADCRAATINQQRFARQVDAVVGISRYMIDLHKRWGLFGDARIQRVIYDANPALSEAAVPSSRDCIRLGYLGRLDPLKGIDLLLGTLTGKLRGLPWSLSLGGRGDPAYEAHLWSRHADPRIRFLGFVPPAELLSQIDVLVVPSLLEEPMARVLIEAYAHGIAVIGANRGGIPEVIEAGRTGLVFDPDEPGGLERAIASLLDDPQRVTAMKAAALAKWQMDFTPGKALAEYREVYERAAALSRR